MSFAAGDPRPRQPQPFRFTIVLIIAGVLLWISSIHYEYKAKTSQLQVSDRVQVPEINDEPTIALMSNATEYVLAPFLSSLWQGRRLEGINVDELFVIVSFADILKTLIFLMVAWLLSAAFRVVGLPSLVGEIVAGFVLGPPLLDFCPFPEAMVLIGNFGLIGLILDSGINLDVAQLKKTGTRAVMLALCGTALALSTGFGFGYLSSPNYLSAIAIGAVFAPSSLGVSSQVLLAGEVLNTPTGQLIVAASVVDDVMGLILLSVLEVFVMDSPSAFDFILPFISSFGYLIVLGYLGIVWIPHLLQNYVLPRIAESKRDAVAFVLLFFLLAAYLPMMDYSGASYLTGAFLAGLSFSQITSVQTAYARSSRDISVWLMRIFFAATIGFQVPVKLFGDADVLKWGFFFLMPVLSKLPLGLFVPRFKHDMPEDFPYDPYWRDVITISLSMLCRGEFNFIIASFSLSVGLLEPEQYGAVVLSILLSCILAPLALKQAIKYYNNKSRAFLEGNHPIERIGKTCDGFRPLFLAIQARTPVHWGLEGKFAYALQKAGIIIVDHRSWNTTGLDAVEITEIFSQDTALKVKVRSCFDPLLGGSDDHDGNTDLSGKEELIGRETEISPMSENNDERYSQEEQVKIRERCEYIRQVLIECLGSGEDSSEYVIQVSQWATFAFDEDEESEDLKKEVEFPKIKRKSGYCFQRQPSHFSIDDEGADETGPSRPRLFSGESVVSQRSIVLEEPCMECEDLWKTDNVTHDFARQAMAIPSWTHGGHAAQGRHSFVFSQNSSMDASDNRNQPDEQENVAHIGARPVHRRNRTAGQFTFEGPGDQPGHRRHHTHEAFDIENLGDHRDHRRNHTVTAMEDYLRGLETETIRGRLHGYVRHSIDHTA